MTVALATAFALAHHPLLPAARIVIEGHAAIFLDRLPTTMATAAAALLGAGVTAATPTAAAAAGPGTRPPASGLARLGRADRTGRGGLHRDDSGPRDGNLDDDAAWRMTQTAVWLIAAAATFGPSLPTLAQHPRPADQHEPDGDRRPAPGRPPGRCQRPLGHSKPHPATSAVADYLRIDLPPILTHGEAAWALTQQSQYFPRVSIAVDLRTRADRAFDDAAAQALDVTGTTGLQRLSQIPFRPTDPRNGIMSPAMPTRPIVGATRPPPAPSPAAQPLLGRTTP
jgi:hypothetical protein